MSTTSGIFTETLEGKNSKWKKYQKLIIYKTVDLCRNMVKSTYVSTAIQSADALVLAFRDISDILGFALLKYIGKDGVYVDVICAKGAGTALLDEVWKFAVRKGFVYIQLSALPHVINFYRRFGFKNTEAQCKADPDVEAFATRVEKLLFADQLEAIKHPEFSQFLTYLVKKGLVHDKGCKDIDLDPPGCSSDGYSMTLCVENYSRRKQIEEGQKPESRKRALRQPQPTMKKKQKI